MHKLIRQIIFLMEKRRSKWKRSWHKLLFNFSIHSITIHSHDKVIAEAEFALKNKEKYESEEACLYSEDPIVRQGYTLKKNIEKHFKGIYSGKTTERILIHVPSANFSPAGYSLFTNIAESFDFIGVPTHIMGWNDNIENALAAFKPTVLLTSDHESYLSRIDWGEVTKYKNITSLKVGLTASLEEYDNTPLKGRLNWAKQHGVDFFYSFRDEAYVSSRKEYKGFSSAGYKILYLPFGANVLHYYPVAGFERDIDYVLIATRKREHTDYLKEIVTKYAGFIDGPGWNHTQKFQFNRERDRYIYARAKVGLNVHLPEQLEVACEVNERTYQLVACGVPQLVDHPKLIDKIFEKDLMLVANTPEEYTSYFIEMMRNPVWTQEKALKAQQEIFGKHTTFHRAESFVKQLADL